MNRRQFLPALASPLVAAAQNRTVDRSILDFGATADSNTLSTKSIQDAIDACHAAGGGRVIVPAGEFRTGTIRLKTNVALYLAAGARLLGSKDSADYPKDAGLCDWHPKFTWGREFTGTLVYAEKADNIALEGPGTIDGSQGPRDARVFPNPGDPEKRRPMLVRFRDCTHVRVKDVTLTNPASFTSLFVGCSDLLFDGVRVRSRDTGNGDGLDFDGCERVRISNCDLDTGDDTIGLKSMIQDKPVQDFVITNCRFSSAWAAIRLGPESFKDMRNIVVSNCVFRNCRDGFKIQCCEGAVMERMLFSNIVMENVLRPFFVTLNIFSMSKHAAGRPNVGKLRDIQATNIHAVVQKRPSSNPHDQPCVAFVGYPGHYIENVTISGFRLTMPGGGTQQDAGRMDVPELLDEDKLYPEAISFAGELPACGIYVRHVRGFKLNDCRIATVAPDARPFIAGDDLEDVSFAGVTGFGSAQTPGLLKFANARDVSLTNSHVRVEGESKKRQVRPGEVASDRPLMLSLTRDEEAKLAAIRRK